MTTKIMSTTLPIASQPGIRRINAYPVDRVLANETFPPNITPALPDNRAHLALLLLTRRTFLVVLENLLNDWESFEFGCAIGAV